MGSIQRKLVSFLHTPVSIRLALLDHRLTFHDGTALLTQMFGMVTRQSAEVEVRRRPISGSQIEALIVYPRII